jgi:hypothetical protein
VPRGKKQNPKDRVRRKVLQRTLVEALSGQMIAHCACSTLTCGPALLPTGRSFTVVIPIQYPGAEGLLRQPDRPEVNLLAAAGLTMSCCANETIQHDSSWWSPLTAGPSGLPGFVPIECNAHCEFHMVKSQSAVPGQPRRTRHGIAT